VQKRLERDDEERASAYSLTGAQARVPHWTTKRPGIYGANDRVRVADSPVALGTSRQQLNALDRSVMAFQHAASARAGSASQAMGYSAPAPGVYGANVFMQMKSGGSAQTAHVHAEAAAGVRGGGSALPFHDRIQHAFGRHDISGIRAHTGTEAKQSASRIGAQAFAMGDDVVLTDTSDLHTAAHEAAHVVQQRGGVSLKGGVGEVGDRYEQHADAVADAVVSGKSAEGLLDQMAGAGAPATQRKAVQRSASGPGPAMGAGQSDLGADRSGEETRTSGVPSHEELQIIAEKVYKLVVQRLDHIQQRVGADSGATSGAVVQRSAGGQAAPATGATAEGHQAPGGDSLAHYHEVMNVADMVYRLVLERLEGDLSRVGLSTPNPGPPANAVASAGGALPPPTQTRQRSNGSLEWGSRETIEQLAEIVFDRLMDDLSEHRRRMGD